MTIQLNSAKPKNQHNGLQDLEAELLAHPEREITAVVTFAVSKRVEVVDPADVYPVVKIKHIEPISGDAEKEAKALQLAAYKQRTGEDELDFSTIEDKGNQHTKEGGE